MNAGRLRVFCAPAPHGWTWLRWLTGTALQEGAGQGSTWQRSASRLTQLKTAQGEEVCASHWGAWESILSNLTKRNRKLCHGKLRRWSCDFTKTVTRVRQDQEKWTRTQLQESVVESVPTPHSDQDQQINPVHSETPHGETLLFLVNYSFYKFKPKHPAK